jgi:outer membrane protein OmpA-like peptidoglycan-associated protein
MIQIYYDKDELDPAMSDVYIQVHLLPLRWWERLWHGIKYIFGYRSRYGDFDEFLFKPEDYKSLKDAAEYLEQINSKINE